MADFESIIKTYIGQDGNIPSTAIAQLTKAISTAVGNEFVDKNRYKAKLDEIETLKADKQTAEDNATTAGKWKADYDALKKSFDDYKDEVGKKETRSAKENAYRELLKAAGVSDKRLDAIVKVSDIDGIELDEKGKIKNAAELTKNVKSEWADFIVSTQQQGANTQNPPSNNGGKTMADIYKKDDHGRYIMSTEERQKAVAELMANQSNE